MEAMSGPHLPVGFDAGLDDLLCDSSLVYDSEMTAFPFDDEQLLWDLDSPHENVSSAGTKSHSQRVNVGASSGSPTGSSLIFTPNSTQLDVQDRDGHDRDFEETSTTSDSNNIAVEDYVYVSSVDGGSSRGSRSTSTRPSHSASSITDRHWQSSFPSTNSVNMDHSAHQSPFDWPSEMELRQTNDNEAMLDVGELEYSHYPGQELPFRTFHKGAEPEASSASMAMISQQMAHLPRASHNLARHGFPHYHGSGSALVHGEYSAGLHIRDAVYDQYLQSMSRNAALPSYSLALPHAVSSHLQPNHAEHTRQRPMIHQHRSDHPLTSAHAEPAARIIKSPTAYRLEADKLSAQAQRALSERSSVTEPASRNGSSHARDQADRVRKGGRSRDSHLSDRSREKSSLMRRVGACWRCAMQRDPCDRGDPCSRCTMRSQKGQTYFFDCDRSKLPDFVHEFLPPSMTIMHQKQTIEDSVASSVLAWDPNNGIDIYLSSGYGPPLLWKVFEFRPKNDEYLHQFQYYQDNDTDQMVRTVNYSPPYGLLKIDTSDETHLDGYLDQLLEPQHLWDFGWSYYEAESLSDERMFQAGVLDLMCKLYLSTTDVILRDLLYNILRMLLITYIMGHTLTISEGTVPTVIANVRHSRKPVNYQQKYTSPRLANQQLKFFFAILRNGIYEKLLKWQQQTLHTAGKKDQTWLPAFCVTLGFAMVLEEVQHTLFIQADASVARGDMTRDEADRVANNACERIDARFKLLVGLFQCKYRDKKWGDNGSFGPSTPEVRDHASQVFLSDLRETVIERYDHLKTRENITFSKENQCYFTSRLTAKFLLPFLQLPG